MNKDDCGIIRAWTMYDWANSVYSLVITSSIFPVYYNAITATEKNQPVQFFGFEFQNSALYSYAISVSFLLVAIMSPLLSGIADYTGTKKKFMQFFCFSGAAACSALYFFSSIQQLEYGIICFILATIGFAGSIVFYNAFLPEIASTENQDQVSARGFAMGYVGSSLLLILCLIMISFHSNMGFANELQATKFSFLITGVWWAGFALITFFKLPEKQTANNIKPAFVLNGYRELKKVWHQLNATKLLSRYLVSFFFYNMGVQTVMYVAALFGAKELNMNSSQLIITILIIQFVAMGGSFCFAWLSKKLSNLIALSIAVSIWILVCAGAYHTYTATAFMMLAALVGLVMGGVQSLSRSTYSKMLPQTQDHASYFSFYDVCDKVGLVIGTASYGLIEELTGSMRNSVFAIALFFILGLFFLQLTRKQSTNNL